LLEEEVEAVRQVIIKGGQEDVLVVQQVVVGV
jgi:hypothetical protein